MLRPSRFRVVLVRSDYLVAKPIAKLCGGVLVVSLFGALTAGGATFTVPGTANPWLAGMPAGSGAVEGDVAPDHSPVQATGVPILPGAAYSFQASGGVTFTPLLPPTIPPDGSLVESHYGGAENGIAGLTAPIGSLIGVFLDDAQPGPSKAPVQPSPAPPGPPSVPLAPPFSFFDTPASRNYLSLSPALKATFFIGNGLASTGEPQVVIAPPGATRLFLGTMDGYGWYSNRGSFQVTVHIVPEPSSEMLLMFVLAAALLTTKRKP